MEILDASGLVADRGRIAERVFDSPEDLNFLNGLIHPRVLDQCQELMDSYQADTNVLGIVLDMPLLMEVHWEKKCDFIVFVDVSEEKRQQRIKKNTEIDIGKVKKRENFQISLDKKRQYAHYKINNNSDKSDLAEQVALIFSNITGSS
jgi:dephospho-CoA kinase